MSEITKRCDSTSKTVLIVEDNTDIREMLKMALEYRGYKVYEAENGQKGLEALSKLKAPCLILLDLMMPVMNGWEFMEALREDMTLLTIPIVVVTAYSEKANSLSDKTEGIIKKPIDLKKLYQSVDDWCGSLHEA